jgi:peptidoglycan/LPS O-acetylase OafA/YrhL
LSAREEPAVKQANRLPGLDGLRAISILLVLRGHLGGTPTILFGPSWIAGRLAEFGVRVFFVISGFLITTLLIAENERSGTISLRDFYIRRTYRIFPAFYTYLAIFAVLASRGLIELMDGDRLAAATYTMNYHRPRSWYLGHLWSLSVEEQFYLVWPALMLLLKKRNALIVAALAVAAAPFIRVAIFVLMPEHRPGIGETFPTVFDALAAGCLLAGVRQRLLAVPGYSAFSSSRAFVAVPLLALGALFVRRVSFDYLVGQTIQNVAIALTVDAVVRNPQSIFGRFLDAAPVAWVGRLSYSLYLWQQPFLNRHGHHWLQSFPLNVILAFVFASLSYYLVEQPVLRLRERRSKRRREVQTA